MADDSFEELPTVVVTGTRSERLLSEVPVRTEVVTRETLERQGARDVAEALRYVPGVLLRQTIGKNGVEVWLQGVSGDRVLILLDGQPLTASTGSTVDLTQIALVDVERIEIVKGAASAQYGSSALGGVINIISQKPSSGFSGQTGLQLGVFGDGGQGASVDESALFARLDYRGSAWQARVALDIRDRQGFDLDETTRFTEGDQGQKINLDGYLGWQGEKQGVYFKPSFYQEEKSYPFSSFAPGVGDIAKVYREDAERQRYLVGYTYQGQGKLELTGLYEKFHDDSRQDTLATAFVDQQRLADITLQQLEASYAQALGNSLLTFGGKISQEQLKQTLETQNNPSQVNSRTEINDVRRDNQELFAQAEIFLSDQHELVPGIRYQQDSDFGDFVAPKLTYRYRQFRADGSNSANWRLSVGQGYRVPNLKERFYVFDQSGLGYILLGNPDLRPETANSVQAGVEWFVNDRLRLESNFYYNRLKDLIISELDPEESQRLGLTVFRYQNLGRAITQGVELGADWRFNSKSRLVVGYTYLEAIDQETNNFLTQRPHHQIKLNLETPIFGRWQGDLGLVGQSFEYALADNSARSPAWVQVDLRLTRPFASGTWQIGIENLLDRTADPNDVFDFSPQRPRFFYSALRYRF